MEPAQPAGGTLEPPELQRTPVTAACSPRHSQATSKAGSCAPHTTSIASDHPLYTPCMTPGPTGPAEAHERLLRTPVARKGCHPPQLTTRNGSTHGEGQVQVAGCTTGQQPNTGTGMVRREGGPGCGPGCGGAPSCVPRPQVPPPGPQKRTQVRMAESK